MQLSVSLGLGLALPAREEEEEVSPYRQRGQEELLRNRHHEHEGDAQHHGRLCKGRRRHYAQGEDDVAEQDRILQIDERPFMGPQAPDAIQDIQRGL